MATLQNSRRRLLQAVHAKISTVRQRPKRAFVKWGLLAGLEPTRDELAALARTAANSPAAVAVAAGQAALSLSGELRGDETTVATVADLPEESMLALADQLIDPVLPQGLSEVAFRHYTEPLQGWAGPVKYCAPTN